jgi:hypothetical protein
VNVADPSNPALRCTTLGFRPYYRLRERSRIQESASALFLSSSDIIEAGDGILFTQAGEALGCRTAVSSLLRLYCVFEERCDNPWRGLYSNIRARHSTPCYRLGQKNSSIHGAAANMRHLLPEFPSCVTAP